MASRPSRNGKNASEAATVPPSAPVLSRATCTASTRLIWPAPTAAARSACANRMVFDLTWAHTRQANRKAVHSSAVGARPVTTRSVAPGAISAPSRQSAAASVTRSRSCTSRAPMIDRTSRRLSALTARGAQSASTRRRFFLAASTSRASAAAAGATTASMNVLAISRAVPASSGRFRPTMPPNADSGSTSRAATYASSSVAAVATPHGFVCLTTTAAGSVNSSASRAAASRSSRLVNESPLPWSTCAVPNPHPGSVP